MMPLGILLCTAATVTSIMCQKRRRVREFGGLGYGPGRRHTVPVAGGERSRLATADMPNAPLTRPQPAVSICRHPPLLVCWQSRWSQRPARREGWYEAQRT